MWSVAPESMTHMEEEEIRPALGLPDPASIVLGLEIDFNNSYTGRT